MADDTHPPAVKTPHAANAMPAVLAVASLLFGLSGVMFPFTTIGDMQWWLWHGLSFLAFGTVLAVVIRRFRRTQIESQQRNTILEARMEERARHLSASQSRISAILNSTIDGIIAIDKQGLIVDFNPAAETLFGYAAAEVKGKNVRMLMPASYANRHDGFLHSYLKTGVKKIIGIGREVSGQRKDGSIFPMELAIAEFELNQERMFTGIVRDISERKRTEGMQAHFAAIIASSSDAIISKDLNGFIVSWNAGATAMFGYSAEEMLGKPMASLIPAAHEDDEVLIWARIRRGESLKNFETMRRRKDGSIFPVSINLSPIRNPQGLIIGASKIAQDISERKLSEAAIRSKDNRIRALVNTIGDGIIVIDAHGKIQDVNPAAVSLFGYALDELQGQNVRMLMPTSFAREHDSYLHNYLNTGQRKVIGIGREVTGQRKDASIFPMELSIGEMEVDGERMFTGIVRDISARKKIERAKNEFVSTVSHELRTPLTAIIGALGMVLGRMGDTLTPSVLKLVDLANKNSVRLAALINDLLDMEKISAGKMHFAMQPQALLPLIAQSVELHRHYGAEHQVQLSLHCLAAEVTVEVDSHRLLQVMANLLSNAIKYSPIGGSVEVTLSLTDELVKVLVHDGGSGIPASFHAQIFQKFSQADSSDTRLKGGTGLGLAIAREMIERMGGSIGFDSIEGQGANFFFTLPSCTLPASPR